MFQPKGRLKQQNIKIKQHITNQRDKLYRSYWVKTNPCMGNTFLGVNKQGQNNDNRQQFRATAIFGEGNLEKSLVSFFPLQLKTNEHDPCQIPHRQFILTMTIGF